MKDFKDILKLRLAQNHLNKQTIGAVALAVLKNYTVNPQEVGGYVKQNILFVKLSQYEDKTSWYLRKTQILDEINTTLHKLGYNQNIKDMKLARR